jgi:hypothetical protein
MFTLKAFLEVLKSNPDLPVTFIFPDKRTAVPPHFHLTEVGKLNKKFVDCGGEQHECTCCSLQLWVKDDYDHRLDSKKFSEIVERSLQLFHCTEVPLVVEWDVGTTALFKVEDVQIQQNNIFVLLEPKNTDCLAKEKCGVGTEGACRRAPNTAQVSASVEPVVAEGQSATQTTMERPEAQKCCGATKKCGS